MKAVCTTDDPTDDLALPPGDRGFRPGDAGVPDVPARQGAQRAPAGAVQSLGGPAGGGREYRHRAALPISSMRSRKRHDFFHADGRPAVRPRPESLLTPTSAPSTRPRRSSTGRAPGRPRRREEHGAVRRVPDAVLRPAGCREGLDQAAPPRRAAQQQHARASASSGPTPASIPSATGRRATRSARYLDRLDQENALPKTIIYNLNPADNYVIATMIGNFQDGIIAGKIQFGSGWWFLDQKEAMEWQMNALSNCGLLSRFVGMLTDSRSFMSYPRHEYFRRVLVQPDRAGHGERGVPDNDELVGPVIRNICYGNAHRFLGLNVA